MDSSDSEQSSQQALKEVKLKWVLLASLLLNTGAALLWPITTLYTKEVLHQSMVMAGLVLTIMAAMMMVGNYIGGRLFDHWSPYKTLLFSVILSTLSTIMMVFFHGWPMYPILLTLIGFGDGVAGTALNAFAAAIKTETSRRVFNWMSVTMNLGVVLGTMLVGLLYNQGVREVFIAASVMYVLFVVVVIWHFKVPALAREIRRLAAKGETFRPSPFVLSIAGLVFAMYFAYVMWEAPIAVHMTNLGMSVQQYTNLWTINGLSIVLLQTAIGWISRKWSYKTNVLGGTFLFGATFVMLIFAHQYWAFILIMFILTLGEMLATPNIPAWVDALTDDAVRGQAQGFVAMMISLGRAAGPLVAGVLIDAGSYSVLFLVVFLFMVAMIVLVAVMDLKRRQRNKLVR